MDRNHIIQFPRSTSPADAAGISRTGPDPRTLSLDTVQFRMARTRADLSGAFRLLQRRYAAAGLAANVSAPMRVLPYHLWSHTQVFVALHRGRVIGSVSLVRDSRANGIPMQSTHPEALSRLRSEGSRVGEVCSLTVDSPPQLSTGELFGQLTRLMMFHARHAGLDQIVAVVHPRHAKFYQMAMGFQLIGELAACNQVGGRPGIPIVGKVNDRSSYRSRWQRVYFEGNYASEELTSCPIRPLDREYFRQFLPTEQPREARRAA